MKNIILILFTVTLVGCYATRPLNNAYIGMPTKEFLKIAKYPEIESSDGDITIYRYKWGMNAENSVFYYFKDNKLIKFDRGVPVEKRYRIEHIRN